MLIVIEGIDGSGKATQAKLLKEYFEKNEYSCEIISFPMYEKTFFGKEITTYLNGGFGGLKDIHPKFASMLYAMERFEQKEHLEKILKEKIVICDRYVQSNMGHQACKFTGKEREDMLAWIEKVEFDILGLPRPDRVFLLDIPVTSSTENVAHKDARSYTAKTHDLHEANPEYLSTAISVYRELAKRQTKLWQTINCTDTFGKMRSKEDISRELVENLPVLTISKEMTMLM